VVELVNLRVSVWGPAPRLGSLATREQRRDAVSAPSETVEIQLEGHAVRAALHRGELPPGFALRGPAIAALPESTLLVPPGWGGEVDAHGTIRLTGEDG
jgi:N-methylhydantoinase A